MYRFAPARISKLLRERAFRLFPPNSDNDQYNNIFFRRMEKASQY